MTPTLPLAWGAKVSPAFRNGVFEICDRFGWDEPYASWLMSCMAFETGATFAPDKRNPASSATGLIQFMASTARRLGTSTAALARMTPERQLQYVLRYFQPYAARIYSLEDMYMAILWPEAISKSSQYVLWPKGSPSYLPNRGLDTNKDAKVTKAEAAAKVRLKLEEGMQPGKVWVPEM